ncbi:MAG: YdeI/OmpD-associated family protein [Actinomycetota bacterium]|nr:YdeI/OmpD-associated family protein [Actinomycetota bacterium]
MTAHKDDNTPELIVADLAAWRCWLADHATASVGVWLVLAKKGTTQPTSLTYDEALEEALCHGWVDGQLAGGHEGTFRRRFTPRRARSAWSKRNIGIIERLLAEGRMRPGGLAAVERAQADGTWDAAYAGAATIETPDDLQAVLGANRAASEMFARLDGANRYAVLYRITTARCPDTRARRIEQLVDMLAQGKTIHPDRKRT